MLAMIGDGLSAGYKSFSDQWNAGFKQGTFATIACPAWMLGYIKGQAGDGQQGQVGRHRGARARAATGAARGSRCPSRASTRRRRPSWSAS